MFRTILICSAVIGVAAFVFSKMPGVKPASRVAPRGDIYRVTLKPRRIHRDPVRVDEPRTQQIALAKSELLRACDDYSYESYSFSHSPKALADKALIFNEAMRELGNPEPRPTSENEIQNNISALCDITWAKNAAARDAINHRLYGNY